MAGETVLLDSATRVDQYSGLIQQIQTFLNVTGDFSRDVSYIGSFDSTVFTWGYWIKQVLPEACVILGVILAIKLAIRVFKKFSR